MRFLVFFLALPLALTAAGDGGGGPFIRYYLHDNSDVDPDFGGSFLVVGGRGYGAVTGWLRVGGGGAASLAVPGAPENGDVSQSFSFGGLILEPFFNLTDGASVSLPILVGGGSYEFQRVITREADGLYAVELYEAGFFCLEPGVEVTWTPLDWFGLGLQGGFIWIMDEKDRFTGSAFAGLMLFFGIG
jgi:hypothetical protein